MLTPTSYGMGFSMVARSHLGLDCSVVSSMRVCLKEPDYRSIAILG